MSDEPSDRVIQQRLHNRYMEELYKLEDWEETIKNFGAGEYFEAFYDWFRDGLTSWHCEILTSEEGAALLEVYCLMNAARSDTPGRITDRQLIDSGWPQRIRPIARIALELMMKRGWFLEKREEDNPSLLVPWVAPWLDRG